MPSRPRVLPVLLAALGLLLLAGGVKLVSLGGSPWYASAGSALIATAVLLWFGSRWANALYGLLFICTLGWALFEVGLDGWALLPRLDVLTVLGIWLLLPAVQRRLTGGPMIFGRRPPAARSALRIWAAFTVVLAAVVIAAVAFTSVRPASAGKQDLPDAPAAAGDWRNYGNDTAGTRYSELADIRPSNVGSLKLAWSFRTGEIARPDQELNFEATPLKIGSTLYFCTPSDQVYALDAASGRQIWHFDPKVDKKGVTLFACRGVSYHLVSSGSEPCAARIYVATVDAKLWSLDALTGNPCAGFGTAGEVDLLSGLGEVIKGMYSVTSPPLVVQDKLILGAGVRDNVSIDMPSGVVRAFDAATGRLAWAWDLGRPDRSDAPVPPDTYTRSTPNVWAPLVADESLGLIYLPLGNPAGDFWGKKRRDFDDFYNTSLVALDVNTGRARWRFQATHHDLWDNDLGSQPVLVDVPVAGGVQPAVIIGTKQGNVFVLNRLTGVPIVPVSERPAPGPSNIGETLSPTQPASTIAVNPGPALLTEATMWGATPIDQMWCRLRFHKLRYQGPYTPPGTGFGSISYPGMFGGIEWGGVSVDPVRKILITNPSAMAFEVRMTPVDMDVETKGAGYSTAFHPFFSPLGMPCQQPPWGKMYAVDLKTNQILWERRVGTVRDSGPLGLEAGLPLLIGTPQAGGTLVTRSGLIFSGATLDRYLRAYDINTGAELWKARMPAGVQATPMTYQAEGRQFVAIAAGGHGVLGTKAGDYLMAYSLN